MAIDPCCILPPLIPVVAINIKVFRRVDLSKVNENNNYFLLITIVLIR